MFVYYQRLVLYVKLLPRSGVDLCSNSLVSDSVEFNIRGIMVPFKFSGEVIKLIGTETIRILAIYRSHGIKKYEFVHSQKIPKTPIKY